MSTSFPVVQRAMADAGPLAAPQAEAAPAPDDRPDAPRLLTPLDLPGELLTHVTRCMIPDSPFLARPSGSVPHFRIAPAMDGLRSMSQTCKPLHAVVADLRKDSDHLPFRQLAGRAEYEFRHRSEVARQASIERYGVDPVHWEGESLVLRLHAYDVQDLVRCKKDLQEYADQVRTISIRLGQSAIGASVDLLADGFAGCTGLDELSVFAKGPLPLDLISAVVRLSPSLKLLKLEGPALPPGLFDCLVAATGSSQIESLVLQVTSITPEDCAAMAQAARHFTRLRFLAVHGAMLSRECCGLLAAALPEFVLLESLQLGREKGGIDTAGALILVSAARSGGKVTRLGLHNLECKDAIASVLEALQQYPGLKELAITGPLDQASSLQPWSLLTGDASCLCALDLENCGLNEQQMESLATAMQSSGRLQELRLAREQFTDKGARALARAIKASTSLLHLTLDDCKLNATIQGRSMGAGVARNKSLLELNVLLKRGPTEYTDRVIDTFSAGVATSSTLLHFGFSTEVRQCWREAKVRMNENRMR